MALEFPIYMDYQSTTPVDPQVADLINKEMRETFGNPHAKSHASGWASEAKIENPSQTFVVPLTEIKGAAVVYSKDF